MSLPEGLRTRAHSANVRSGSCRYWTPAQHKTASKSAVDANGSSGWTLRSWTCQDASASLAASLQHDRLNAESEAICCGPEFEARSAHSSAFMPCPTTCKPFKQGK